MDIKLTLDDVMKEPITIHIAAVMGAGKSMFIKLLQANERWLMEDFGLEEKFVYPFIEDTPHGEDWKLYQDVITGDKPHIITFDTQSWFMNQKLGIYYQAAGQDYPGCPGFFRPDGNIGLDARSRFSNYNYNPNQDRKPGIYIGERLAKADLDVFAARYKHLFIPGDKDTPGSYEHYRHLYSKLVDEAPLPDVFLELLSTPKISKKRVDNRGTGEKLSLEDYEEMDARYTLYVKPFIKCTGRPCISIDTTLPSLDYTSPDGQAYMLTRFFRELREINEDYWKLDRNLLRWKPYLSKQDISPDG